MDEALKPEKLELFGMVAGAFEFDEARKLYRKEVARAGTYRDSRGKVVTLDKDYFEQLIKNFNAGDDIPVPLGHEGMKDPSKNTGYVRALETDGVSLFALFEFTEKDIEDKVKNETIKHNSIGVVIKDCGRVLEHIALTLRPAITGLLPFQQVALEGREYEIYEFEESKTKKEEVQKNMDEQKIAEELKKQREEFEALRKAEESRKSEESKKLKEEISKLREERVEFEVAKLIEAGKITESQKDAAKKMLLADETIAKEFFEKNKSITSKPETVVAQKPEVKEKLEIVGISEAQLEAMSYDESKAVIAQIEAKKAVVMPDRVIRKKLDREELSLDEETGRYEFTGYATAMNILNTGSFLVPKLIETKVLMQNEGKYQFDQIAIPATKANSSEVVWNVVGTISVLGTSMAFGSQTGTSAFTLTQVSLKPARYGNSISWTEEIADWSVTNLKDNIAFKLLSEDYRRTMDTEAYKVLIAGNAVVSGNTVVCGTWANGGKGTLQLGSIGSWNTALVTTRNVVFAKTLLRKNRAMTFDGGDYVAYMSPEQLFSFQSGTGWIESRNYADTVKLLSGEVGRYMGVRFVDTDIIGQFVNERKLTAGTGTSYSGVMVGYEALGKGFDQPLKITYYDDDPQRADAGYFKRLQWNARGKYARLKDDNVVVLESQIDSIFY